MPIYGVGMTNPMTTTGDIIYGQSGAVPGRIGIGTAQQGLKTVGGVPTWAFPLSSQSSYNSSTTIAATDNVATFDASGGALTMTMPSAATYAGNIIYLQKTDSSTNSVTLTGFTTLDTQDETLIAYANGSAWRVLERKATTAPVAYTPTFTGFGTVASVNFRSWRAGAVLRIQGTFTAGTPTSTEARVTLGFNGTSANVTSSSGYPTLQMVGPAGVNSNSTTYFGTYAAIEASKTYFVISRQSSTANVLTKANGDALINAGGVMTLTAEIQIEGWKG